MERCRALERAHSDGISAVTVTCAIPELEARTTHEFLQYRERQRPSLKMCLIVMFEGAQKATLPTCDAHVRAVLCRAAAGAGPTTPKVTFPSRSSSQWELSWGHMKL